LEALARQLLPGSNLNPRLMKSTAWRCCLAQAANGRLKPNRPYKLDFIAISLS